MKRVIIFSLTLVMVLSLGIDSLIWGSKGTVAVAKSLKKITLRMGTVQNVNSNFNKGLNVMADAIKKYSNGNITMKVFPDGQLGAERDMIEGVSLGTIEMCMVSSAPLANFSSDFLLFDLPYLVTNREKAYRVFDGKIGRSILDTLKAKGIYAFSFWENGYRNITNNKKPIVHPADMKGMKIRVMENEVQQATFKALGAFPTPMAWPEVFTALEQGVIDAQENPMVAIASTKIYEIQKYVTLTGHVYTPGVVLINAKLFNSFSKETRKIIRKAEAEARVWERNYSEELDAKLIQELKAKGIVFTKVKKAEWKAAVQPVYAQYKNKINQNFVKAFK
jgi:tripartite ATP-independent transporter DctP family solute receptor